MTFSVEFYATDPSSASIALDEYEHGNPLPPGVRVLLDQMLRSASPRQAVHVKAIGHVVTDGTAWGAVSNVEIVVRWIPLVYRQAMDAPPTAPLSVFTSGAPQIPSGGLPVDGPDAQRDTG